MPGIIELLRTSRAALAVATRAPIGEAPGHISAAAELIAKAEAALIGGAAPIAEVASKGTRAEPKRDLLAILRRHKTGMSREAIITALGWAPGLTTAHLNRHVAAGRVKVADGRYCAVEKPPPVQQDAAAA